MFLNLCHDFKSLFCTFEVSASASKINSASYGSTQMSKVILLMAVFYSQLFASIGIDLGIQKPFNATGSWPVISAALIKTMDKPPFYFSTGIVLRPGNPLGTETTIDHTEEIRKTHSFFGIFAGTYTGITPALRPGIVAGCTFKREEIYAIVNGLQIRKSYTPYNLNPYIGLSVHFFILSFLITTEGIGGGIISFK